MKLKTLIVFLAFTFFVSSAWANPNRPTGEKMRANAKATGQELGYLDMEKGLNDFWEGVSAPFKKLWPEKEESKQKSSSDTRSYY